MKTDEFERIAIMGAGSLGIILGAYIAQQRQVDLIVGSRTSADALDTNGAQVTGNIEMRQYQSMLYVQRIWKELMTCSCIW